MGYSSEDKKLDPEVLRKHIMGGHVAEYMEEMQEEAPEKYQTHFSQWIKAEIEPEDIEELYKSVSADSHITVIVCMGSPHEFRLCMVSVNITGLCPGYLSICIHT